MNLGSAAVVSAEGYRNRLRWATLAAGVLCCAAVAGEETARPKFESEDQPAPGMRKAKVTLSPDSELKGAGVRARGDLKILVMPDGGKKRMEIEVARVAVLRQSVLEEGLEKEWRWKEGGSDEKILTGRSYPWRKYGIEVQTDDGKTVKGTLTSGFPITIEWWEDPALAGRDKAGAESSCRLRQSRQFLVQPKAKGEFGQTLDDLVYVKEIDFRPVAKAGKDGDPKEAEADGRGKKPAEPREEAGKGAPAKAAPDPAPAGDKASDDR